MVRTRVQDLAVSNSGDVDAQPRRPGTFQEGGQPLQPTFGLVGVPLTEEVEEPVQLHQGLPAHLPDCVQALGAVSRSVSITELPASACTAIRVTAWATTSWSSRAMRRRSSLTAAAASSASSAVSICSAAMSRWVRLKASPSANGSPANRSRVGARLAIESDGSVRTAALTPTPTIATPSHLARPGSVGADREGGHDHGQQDADLVGGLQKDPLKRHAPAHQGGAQQRTAPSEEHARDREHREGDPGTRLVERSAEDLEKGDPHQHRRHDGVPNRDPERTGRATLDSGHASAARRQTDPS